MYVDRACYKSKKNKIYTANTIKICYEITSGSCIYFDASVTFPLFGFFQLVSDEVLRGDPGKSLSLCFPDADNGKEEFLFSDR